THTHTRTQTHTHTHTHAHAPLPFSPTLHKRGQTRTHTVSHTLTLTTRQNTCRHCHGQPQTPTKHTHLHTTLTHPCGIMVLSASVSRFRGPVNEALFGWERDSLTVMRSGGAAIPSPPLRPSSSLY